MTHEQLLQLGILVVIVGFAIIASSFFFTSANEKESGFKFSVVGFFGLIPFGFGNDRKLVITTLIIATAIVAAAIMLFSRNLKP